MIFHIIYVFFFLFFAPSHLQDLTVSSSPLTYDAKTLAYIAEKGIPRVRSVFERLYFGSSCTLSNFSSGCPSIESLNATLTASPNKYSFQHFARSPLRLNAIATYIREGLVHPSNATSDFLDKPTMGRVYYNGFPLVNYYGFLRLADHICIWPLLSVVTWWVGRFFFGYHVPRSNPGSFERFRLVTIKGLCWVFGSAFLVVSLSKRP